MATKKKTPAATPTPTEKPDETNEDAALEAALNQDQAAKAEGSTEPTEDNPDSQVDAEPEKTEPAPAAQVAKAQNKKAKPTPPAPADSFNETIAGQRKARDEKIAEAEKELEPPAELTEEEVAKLKRQDEIQAKLQETAEKIEKAEKTIEKLKAQARDLMAELYPHTVESDKHVDAVRGYLKSAQEERANRGAHPARLRELLSKAGLAPIDAAFQRARARGQARPTRSVSKPNPGGQE